MVESEPAAALAAEAWRQAERKFWLSRRTPELLETAAEGEIDLATGSPPFPVDPRVRAAVAESAQRTEHLSYPPTAGLEGLREAIAAFDREHLGARYDAGQVVVTYGAMQALFDVIRAVTNPGDEVLLPTPYWFQFPHLVSKAGALHKNIQTFPGNNFKLTPKLLAAALSPNSRLLLLTNPNNPTGAVYTRDELADLAALIKGHSRLLVISDEVYNLLLLDGSGRLQAAPSLCSFEDIAERVFVVNSMSKNFAMSGLRVGYAATAALDWPEEIAQRQRFSSLGVNVYLQAGAQAAIGATADIVGDINRALAARRPAAERLLGLVPRFRFVPPEASFYFWVDVSGYLGCSTPQGKVIRDDVDLASYLSMAINKRRGVAVVNGSGCGMPGYFRITYAVPEETFAEGIRRIKERLAALHCES